MRVNLDRFTDLLIKYDDRLRNGRGQSAITAFGNDGIVEELDDDLRRRLEGATQCLRLLEHARLSGHAAGITKLGDSSGDASAEGESGPGHIGRFELVRELGRGGHGIVYLVWDPQAQRHVALKTPHPELLFTAEDRRRFLREGIAAARLSHPNIVSVLEVDQSPPNCYIVSTYCEGKSLAAFLAGTSEPITPALAARWVAALADGVEHAHEHGILHRDLKPANVVLEQPPRGLADRGDRTPPGAADEATPLVPKLTDFGLAKLLDSQDARTKTGVMLGTPNYMAPEQVDAAVGEVDRATDVYGLGAILYELLARNLRSSPRTQPICCGRWLAATPSRRVNFTANCPAISRQSVSTACNVGLKIAMRRRRTWRRTCGDSWRAKSPSHVRWDPFGGRSSGGDGDRLSRRHCRSGSSPP